MEPESYLDVELTGEEALAECGDIRYELDQYFAQLAEADAFEKAEAEYEEFFDAAQREENALCFEDGEEDADPFANDFEDRVDELDMRHVATATRNGR